ncbi:murF protein [Flavobacterium saliperosum S13]|uniref:UDP-N-acetylmuramoyl-tripeptide--D-alanyl-D-alanine ligase n=2 Tax=Flavobacterium saliperosum TaxID=329186 RepID=A0A1G4VMJ7_9FLAO|nr:UDP-N-acetylmuramoyl-tripeptide--D-alanyl-D-alanine ligase [Flavobacterium saliperosum]ESU23647.1 murF protein [Flavobacterium saliperosum S13]SCX09031.1 UDP-N-acetylmuramoyl-tripeptide--D-alanyl-D-alanine ligase [Flavobacterium saliperosum]
MKTEEIYQCFLQSTGVCTDTRKITSDCIFFALKGENFDANEFAQQALNQGAAFAVIDNKKYFTDEDKMLLVDDSLKALQLLAHYHRKELGLPIIALTGSNGKTTTKELINAVLSKKYITKATVGNLNNHIGVPLTLLSFDEDTDIGIVEMGANHQKEIALLCAITEPDYGYITNFGKAHLEGFGGIEGVIKGKSELYEYLEHQQKTAFVNLDDRIQKEKTTSLTRYTFSLTEKSDVTIDSVTANPMVKIGFKNLEINSHLIGIYNANNINAALTIGTYFNVETQAIKEAIENYIPSNNRSQLTEKKGNRIILDAYNANPSSMTAAIENFVQLDGESKIAVLGDMFELGKDSLEEHKKIVELLIKQPKIETYFIGKDFFGNKTEYSNLHFYDSFEAFSSAFQKSNPIGKTILIKGSRGMALERTLEIL